MEEDEANEEGEDVPPAEKTPTKKRTKKRKKKDDAENKEIIELPPCQHAWCLGEVLKKAGIEPGVCCPRPLPWALTGNLRYLPGYEEKCRNYRLQKVYYNVKAKRANVDSERFAKEVQEAKLLWSYVEPSILYPRNLTYEDPVPGIVCDCKEGFCKRKKENEGQKQQ